MPSIRRSRLIVFRFAAAGPVRWKKGSSSSGTAAPFFDGPPFSAFAALPLGGVAAGFGGGAAASSPPSSLALDARSPDARSAFAASRSAFRAAAASFFSSFVSFFSKSFSSPLCSPPPLPIPALSMRCRSSSVISASRSARSMDSRARRSESSILIIERWPESSSFAVTERMPLTSTSKVICGGRSGVRYGAGRASCPRRVPSAPRSAPSPSASAGSPSARASRAAGCPS